MSAVPYEDVYMTGRSVAFDDSCRPVNMVGPVEARELDERRLDRLYRLTSELAAKHLADLDVEVHDDLHHMNVQVVALTETPKLKRAAQRQLVEFVGRLQSAWKRAGEWGTLKSEGPALDRYGDTELVFW